MGRAQRIYGKVLYHEMDERVDFLFVNAEENPTFGVLVAFEPGHPEHYHRDDAWGVFWIQTIQLRQGMGHHNDPKIAAAQRLDGIRGL